MHLTSIVTAGDRKLEVTVGSPLPDHLVRTLMEAKTKIARNIMDLLNAGEEVFSPRPAEEITPLKRHLETDPNNAIFLRRKSEDPNVPLYEPRRGFITEKDDRVTIYVRPVPDPADGPPDFSVRAGYGTPIKQSLADILPDDLKYQAMLLSYGFETPGHSTQISVRELTEEE